MMNIRKLIKENEFHLKKKYGQNFLLDQNILNKIINIAKIDRETLVVEIGVGAGLLTSKIALVAGQVVGYEIDRDLKNINDKVIGNKNNVEIIYEDFLARNLNEDLGKYQYDKKYLISNLPYYITTPIINKFIKDNYIIDKMIIMVQKEVGDRITARPGTKEYNSLTIFLNYYYDAKKCFKVSPSAFIPKPNVDSVILELTAKKNKPKVKNEKEFFQLIRDAFKQKRKTLRNNLRNYDLVKIEKVLKEMGFDLNVRAEQLTLEQFVLIANSL